MNRMFATVFLLLCITFYANTAILPNIDVSESQNAIFEDDQKNAINSNTLTEDSINEIVDKDILTSYKPNICTTQICVKESARMLGSMDESVNPCENFYEFACGKFVRETVLPEDKDSQSSFSIVEEKVTAQIKSILTEDLQPNEPNPYKLAKIFTKSCTDEATLNERGKRMLESNQKFLQSFRYT